MTRKEDLTDAGWQEGGHGWAMIDDVLSHGSLHPCTNPIPDALPVARSAKLPNDTKAAAGSGRPRFEAFGQRSQEIHRLARLEMAGGVVRMHLPRIESWSELQTRDEIEHSDLSHET